MLPIEGIIYGLKMAAKRHPEDIELALLVLDAKKALSDVEAKLDEAFIDGRFSMADEFMENLLFRKRGKTND